MNQISLGFSKAWSVRLVLRQREMESLHTNEREHLCQERAGLPGLGYCGWKWQYQDFPKVEPGTLRFGCPIASSGPFPEGIVDLDVHSHQSKLKSLFN